MSRDPFNLDFAALRTLRAVHANGSFSRAAEKLGLTQPTISYTIARLREAFEDPLFVRQGIGIVPTDRCNEIVAQTSELTDRFEALIAPRSFDPTTARAEIAISCNYYERVVILPGVIRLLRREARGIRIRIIPSTVYGREQLNRSESDILLGPIEIQEENYYRRGLLKETYTCVMDPSNPLARGPLSFDAYLAAPQVIVNYGGSFRSRFLTMLDAQGASLNNVMEVPSPSDIPDLLRGTDLIATVPTRIARYFGAEVTAIPCPVPAEISIVMNWTARTHLSAPHSWLREQIARTVSEIDAG
ncbi:LysR family transcriptional regulator [Pseudooceanicola sp.]|uniref:LysR family transcriptional regulator n=1 Tax=Pseudooceanicola sp. TaxID=1914328 RepID=UPI0035C6CF47